MGDSVLAYLRNFENVRPQLAKWEVGQIQLVTSRLLEIGSKPDKKQSASFEFNKIIPFGILKNTKLRGLGFPNAWVPVGTELTNHEIQTSNFTA